MAPLGDELRFRIFSLRLMNNVVIALVRTIMFDSAFDYFHTNEIYERFVEKLYIMFVLFIH